MVTDYESGGESGLAYVTHDVSQERGVLQMGRRHGGGVAAERGGVRALGAHGGARGGAAGRVAAARQAKRRAARRAAARARARAAAHSRQALNLLVNIHLYIFIHTILDVY